MRKLKTSQDTTQENIELLETRVETLESTEPPEAGGGLPYKVYSALITQTGTNDPTVIILENTLGETIVWTRQFAGSYLGTSTGTFTANKTSVSLTSRGVIFKDCYNNIIEIGTYISSTVTGADGLLNRELIEIRVYN